jgi:DNA-binding transcriptional LysR family regulator
MVGARGVEMYQIRYFLALSETLNFTHAAASCNVTQPALTRAIQCLEAELGGELVRRERSLSHLTDLGARMLPLMRQCYEAALAAKTMAQSIRKGDVAAFSIAVSHTVELAPFMSILGQLSRALPNLQLKMRRASGSEICKCLKSGEAELAIAGPLGEAWSRLDAFPLFDESFDLFVGRKHRLSGRSDAEFKDLSSETLVVNTKCEMADELIECLRTKGIEATRLHRVATQSDLLTLVEANLGVAIIPTDAARSYSLNQVRLNQLDFVRKVSVYSAAGRRRGACCTTMLNMLRAADWRSGAITKQKTVVQ